MQRNITHRTARLGVAVLAASMVFTGAAQAHPAKHRHHAKRHGHHARKHAAGHGSNAAADPAADGSYSGSQDAGPDLSFAVVGNGTHVKNFSTWAVPGCTVNLVQVQIADMTIKGRSFTGTEQTDGGSVQVSGSFDSSGHATGSIQWTVADTPACDSTRSFTAGR